jgi:thioredoxin reductase (NADPH)
MDQQNLSQNSHIYETIIVGGGPAGLTAGLYLSRSRVDVLLMEKALPGGQANLTEMIENYPGFPEGILGPDLMQRFEKQARRFGLEIKNDTVLEIAKGDQEEEKYFQVKTDSNIFYCKSIIISSGAQASQLGVPGENEFRGRGVSYCATCDGAFFREKEIVVVGGGDAAIEEALFLTKFASKVNVVHRRGDLRAAKILQERAFANPKINFIWHSIVREIKGNEQVEVVQLKNVTDGQEISFPCQGVFIFTGYSPTHPSLGSFKDQIVNEKGYILTDECMMTPVEGVFACGDVRAKVLRQVVTACGEGANAAFFAEKYLGYLSSKESE